MNASVHASAGDDRADITLAEVDFKWLMAGQGCWIDTARLRIDRAYAQACFAQARGLHCDPLSACASQLSALLAPSMLPGT